MAHRCHFGLLTLLALSGATTELRAQGITTAAVQGTVVAQDSAPITNAIVEVTNTATGQSWRVETYGAGRYFAENVAIGGPYEVTVRAIGFRPAARTGMTFTAGQRYTADFTLEPATAQLPEIVVRADASSQANPGRTGPAQLVPDAALRQLPNLGREVVNQALLSPQVSHSANGGLLQIGGQSPLYTGVLVDGGQNTGLLSGAGPLPHSISPETVEELQVLAAPADVRYGDFAGGALSIVTRSGSNKWHGSAYGFLQNQDLVGTNAAGDPQPDFATWQYGGSVSGPIVRNRLHFFLNADIQHAVTPDNGPFLTGTPTDLAKIGIRGISVARFDSILSNVYGLDPGGSGRRDGRSPAVDLFGKLSLQIGSNDHLELSHHFAREHDQSAPARDFGLFRFSSVGDQSFYTLNVSRLIWRRPMGRRWSNEVILGYLYSQLRNPNAELPNIVVRADSGDIQALPASPNARNFRVSQGIFELTDNLTTALGPHLLTFGTHNELLQFKDNNFAGSGGNWVFGSLDSLALGLANHYDREVPGPLQSSGPNVDYRVRLFGLYAQDQWALTRRFTLTAGLRLDVPFFPDRGTLNPEVRDSLGFETGQLPSGDLLWSPRLGFNYDIGGRGTTFLRGTIGLFTGHPAYRWISNGYRDSGGEQALLHCDRSDGPDAVPAFDPLHPPLTCGSGAEPPEPRITVFDPGLKYPQNWKLALGVDQRLPWGLVATLDLLYTRWVNQFYFTDLNLSPPIATAAGEGGRLLYGTIAEDGSETPSRIHPTFGQIVRVSNRSGDRAFQASVQVQRPFGAGFGFSASYTYSRAQDLFSLVNYFAALNLGHTPLDGSLADRRMTTSWFEIPHQIVVAASVGLPLRTRLSLEYAGGIFGSQEPYTYVVEPGDANVGDVNADGLNLLGVALDQFAGNDVVYVPKDVRPGGDISLVVRDEATGELVPAPASTYTELDQYIKGEHCLDRQRGHIMERNSCRNRWRAELNARVANSIPTLRGHSVEISADIFNLLSLLKRSWGQQRVTACCPELPLLRLQGYDTVKQRGIYELNLPARDEVFDFESRWRLQLGMRYSF